MRRALKTIAWSIGIMMLLSALAFWRTFYFYPKVWKARIAVDERHCDGCALYVSLDRVGGILLLREGTTTVSYSLAFPSSELDVPKGAVWKCVEGAYFFVPGLAFHNEHQFCAPWGTANSQTGVEMTSQSSVFTADDGKRVKVEW